MLWLFAVFVDVILETIIALRYRQVAQQRYYSSLSSTAVMYALGVMPVGLAYAVLNMHAVHTPSAQSIVWIALAAAGFVLTNVMIFIVYRHIEASIYTLISSSKYVVIAIAAYWLIGEQVSLAQLLGIACIITSCIVVSYKLGRDKRSTAPLRYVVLAFIASVIVAFAHLSERMALGLSSPATYIVFGWGLQVIGLVVLSLWFARKVRIKKCQLLPLIQIGLMRGLAGVCVVYAVSSTQNVTIVSSLLAIKVVSVALASYMVLGERSHAYVRIGGAVTAAAGIWLIVG